MRADSLRIRISCLSGAFALCCCSEPSLARFAAAIFYTSIHRWIVMQKLLLIMFLSVPYNNNSAVSIICLASCAMRIFFCIAMLRSML